jgi:hypothetical protein
MSRHVLARTLTLLSLAACATAPTPLPPRSGTAVSTSAGRTWDAAIATLADRQIAIGSMDRASGFLASAPIILDGDTGGQVADCGLNTAGVLGRVPATDAIYNILVRGDSGAATLRVTAQYSADVRREARTGKRVMCASRGLFEQQLEAEIKARAEAAR